MKQRLLLVLLALFTSIGWMNAGIALKVPQGATGSLTISKVTTGEIQEPITINGQTISSNSYTYKIDDIAKNNDATITLGGSIKSLNISTKVTEITVDGAFQLTDLTFSKESQITKFDFTGTNGALANLTADNCGLISLPTNLKSALADKATVSLKNNKLTNIIATDLVDKENISYSFDGNQISQWPTLKKASISYGKQTNTVMPMFG